MGESWAGPVPRPVVQTDAAGVTVRGGWSGVVRAVVAVVDHDAFGAMVLGVREGDELGLGGGGVL